MATVTITITDLPGDKVNIVAEPNFETMMNALNSGSELSCAQGYGVALLNKAREISAQAGPLKLLVPRKGIS